MSLFIAELSCKTMCSAVLNAKVIKQDIAELQTTANLAVTPPITDNRIKKIIIVIITKRALGPWIVHLNPCHKKKMYA